MACLDVIAPQDYAGLRFLRFNFDRSLPIFAAKPATGHYRRIAAFLDFLDQGQIDYFVSYDEVRWEGEREDGCRGAFIRKLALICVPDPNDRLLLRLRFDCLPLSDAQDLRGPWRPRLAHATVELHDR